MIFRSQLSDMKDTAPIIGDFARTCFDATLSAEEIVDKVAALASAAGVVAGGVAGIGLFARAASGLGLKTIIRVGATHGAIGALFVTVSSILDETALRIQAALSSGSETFIYVLPKDDYNGASHLFLNHEGVRKLAVGKKLVVQRINSSDELANILQVNHNISHLWINAHGNSQFIRFGKGEESYAFCAFGWPRSHFVPNAEVIIDACKAGEGIGSFGELLQSILGPEFSVTAPTISISPLDIWVQNGKVTFRRLYEDVTARFPGTPREKPNRSTFGIWPTMCVESYKEVDMGEVVRPRRRDCRIEEDRIVEILNQEAAEHVAYKALKEQVEQLKAYFEAKDREDALFKDKGQVQSFCLDAATAARNFGSPKLAAIFDMGYQMIKFEETAKHIKSVENLTSPAGVSAIASMVSAGFSMVGVFATLDHTPSNVLGPLQEQIKLYNTYLSYKIEGICCDVKQIYAEQSSEFEKVREDLFSMYQELKDQNGDLLQSTRFVKKALGIGFSHIERTLDLFQEEADYCLEEIRLESIRKVEDGINHYEYGKVPIDRVKEWAATLERWISTPLLKKNKDPESIEVIARSAKISRLVEIEENKIKSLVNIQTIEFLLPSYTTVRKILRQEGVLYDPKWILWEELMIRPLEISEFVATALEGVEGSNWKKHHQAYVNQIGRIREVIKAKKVEILSVPSLSKSVEKLEQSQLIVAASEDYLTEKMESLIIALRNLRK